MPIWARVVVGVAAARVSVGLILFLAGQVTATTAVPSTLPVWPYALLSASFAIVGAGLVITNKHDDRAAWLGGLLVLLACPLSERLLAPAPGVPPGVIAAIRPDTFLPAFLWRFVADFPSRMGGRAGAAARIVARVLEVVGAAAFMLTLSALMVPLERQDPRRLFLPGVDGRAYWPITFLAGLAAMLTLVTRMIGSGGSDRFRLRVFTGGLLFGLAPIFIEVIIEESWPAYKALVHQPAIEPWVGALLFVPMAAVPLVVSYSALYDRVVETRVALRVAAQYLLARATIVALSIVPLIALVVFLYERRAESLASLFAGPRPIALLAIIAAAAVVFRLRRRWLQALDRRYFREAGDPRALLSHLMTGDWITQRPEAIAAAVSKELDAVFHARADLFVLDPVSGELRDPRGTGAVLGVRSMLATLLTASPQPMEVDTSAGTALTRIPPNERAWLDTGPYTLLVPLRTKAADLIGLLAMGAKRSELPYSDADRVALAAVALPVALALENDRLRSSPDSHSSPSAGECVSCSRLLEAGARMCSCGGQIVEAAAPYMLRGVYRFERRLGAGGMGVVYLARDLSLDRHVAIKTLPLVESAHQAGLRTEAQAMASIVDGNLAVIYGIESWRGVPFLVEEYLEGGTLSWRMARKPVPIAEALDLGITLAGALDRLHQAGIVHCDIKPSNIGFSRTGVVKLIDFGLAHLLHTKADALDETTTVGTTAIAKADETLSTIVTSHGLVGTPAYMSPEALRGVRPNPAFDVWSLSVVLFELIAGRRPFLGRTLSEVSVAVFGGQAPDIRELRPECGATLARFFAQELSADRAARHTTGLGYHQALLALRREVP